jgi:hypothetical protein
LENMVKEIRELEDEIRELEVGSSDVGEENWEEQDLVDEDSEDLVDEDSDEKDEGFSIGDTMLGRGEKRNSWRTESLEDKAWEEEEDDFGDDGFDEDEGFSYEDIGRGGDDFYGAVGGSDIYGVSDAINGPYGPAGQSTGAGGYSTGGAVTTGYDINVGGGSGDASYVFGGKKKGKSDEASLYKVAGSGKKKSRRSQSGLVGSLNSGKKKKSTGVSMY